LRAIEALGIMDNLPHQPFVNSRGSDEKLTREAEYDYILG